MIDSTFPSATLVDERLWRFLARLTCGEPIAIDDTTEPPWFEPGVICEIPMETYFGILEQILPNWRLGSVFVSGETYQRVFWRQGDAFYGRELTVEESRTFDELAERFPVCRDGRNPDCCSGGNSSYLHLL